MNFNRRDPKSEILRVTENKLVAALEEAIAEATADAEAGFRALGDDDVAMPAGYFHFAALRALFLRHCGADVESGKDGDPVRASRLVHIGERLSRYWSQKDGASAVSNNEVRSETEEQVELAHSAERMVLHTVVRLLIEGSEVKGGNVRQKATEVVDSYIAGLDPKSEQTEIFGAKAKGYLDQLTRRSD